MGSVKIELNPAGIAELFKSAEMQAEVQSVGDAVAAKAMGLSGEAYAASTHNAGFTAIANVYPDSREAAHDNFQNNTLLKAAGELGLPQTKPHL